jgi:hypothetical protein
MRSGPAICALLAACSRGALPVTTDAGTVSQPTAAAPRPPDESDPSLAPNVPATKAAPPPPAPPPPRLAEAERTTIARLEGEPLLRPHLSMLRDHFGADPRGPFALQRADLVGGRTALLVSRAGRAEPSSAAADPAVLVVDRDSLAWSKNRPTAGIVPPVQHVTIAPRPDGGVVLFAYVPAMHLLAARMWAEDGNPFAEIELGTFDVCDALSAAYASGRGWYVACTSPAGTRAQRLRENGMTAWSHDGAALGAATPVAPASIAFDTASSFLIVERARAVGGDRILAFRFDDDARPLWPAGIEAGVLAGGSAGKSDDRVRASLAREGVVRIEWPGKQVEVDSTGAVGRIR